MRSSTSLALGFFVTSVSASAWAAPAGGADAPPVAATSPASAPPTKEECIEAHSKAQDARERGQLSEGKRLFVLCAQAACPALVQADCSKFGEDLARSLPSISFSARDPKGADLPDTQVFVDGTLIASRLDDGKAHDIDPGKHVVRFVHGDKESSVNVVVAAGERGRNLIGMIGNPLPASDGDRDTDDGPRRPVAPLVLAGVGGVAIVTGVVLGIVGLVKVPSQCSTSARECIAAPGDKAFGDAESAVNLANAGLAVGLIGLAAAVGGLVWYFATPPSSGGSTPPPPPTPGANASTTALLRW